MHVNNTYFWRNHAHTQTEARCPEVGNPWWFSDNSRSRRGRGRCLRRRWRSSRTPSSHVSAWCKTTWGIKGWIALLKTECAIIFQDAILDGGEPRQEIMLKWELKWRNYPCKNKVVYHPGLPSMLKPNNGKASPCRQILQLARRIPRTPGPTRGKNPRRRTRTRRSSATIVPARTFLKNPLGKSIGSNAVEKDF